MGVSWTQAAGTTFTAPSFTVTVHSTNGSAATATAYLTNAVGAGATVANQLGTTSVTVSAATATAVTISFPAVTLPPGTYYLILSNFSANFAWDFVGGGATEVVGTGVTSNPDVADTATPTPAFPPSGAFLSVSAGGSQKVFLYTATGTSGTTPPPGGGGGPTTVPTLGTFGIVGTGILLGFAGVLFLKRQSENPLR